MTQIREILRLQSLEVVQVKIAESCNCSRDTVKRILKKAKNLGIGWPLDKKISDEELEKLFYPRKAIISDCKMPNVERIHKELLKKGVTLKLLWHEYYEECLQNNEKPFMLTQFCFHYRKYASTKNPSMHISRKPGEIIEVDWAGSTASIVDDTTGELITIYVFVGVLPYSGYTYVEGFTDMSLQSWISAHTNMFQYFGGISKIITPDNLKTGVNKPDSYEAEINKTYREMSEHYGTAIIPARIVKPKDKATVEGTVGNVSTWIIAALRNSRFFSVYDINQAIKLKLEELNNKPFQKREGSRNTIFRNEEKLLLLPLPEYPYELAQWKVATVQLNYHVSVDKRNYSVPHEYIGQKVDVRLSKRMIEVFYKHTRIATHIRQYGPLNKYLTVLEHMPPNHQSFVQWDGDRFKKWAKKIGENTLNLIELVLKNQRVEQQAYKSCLGILKLSDRFSEKSLDAVCKKVLSYTQNPSYKTVKALIETHKDEEESNDKSTSNIGCYTRGANYYGGRK